MDFLNNDDSDDVSDTVACEDAFIDISMWNLMFAVGLFSLNGFLSVYLALGLNKKLGVAALRCMIQLALLGFLLRPVFKSGHWIWVLLFSTAMLFISSVEVMSRPSYSYTGMYQHILIGIGGSCTVVLVYTYLFVITWRSKYKWYEPQYLIPILGMLLGNTISGVSLGLTTVLEELSAGRERVEALLAVGATRMEATRGVVQRSLHVALIPMINQMSVVGIVSIPGMMTGEILAGVSPVQAARYQIAILFLIGSTTALSSVITVLLAICWVVDGDHRLRHERLNLRNRPAGVEVWIMAHTMKAIDRIRQFAKRLYVLGSGQMRTAWNDDAPALRHWGLYGALSGETVQNTQRDDVLSDEVFAGEPSIRPQSFERDALLPH